jgi:hypothetical protein
VHLSPLLRRGRLIEERDDGSFEHGEAEREAA